MQKLAIEIICHPKLIKEKILGVGKEHTSCSYTNVCSIAPPVFHVITCTRQ